MRRLVRALLAGVAALLAWALLTMAPGTRALWGTMLAALGRGEVGVGVPGTSALDFSALDLLPGDLVLGGNPGTSWGYWTHAAIYVGDGRVMDSLLRFGVHPEPVDRFAAAYARTAVLRVKVPQAVRDRAVRVARSLEGRPFNLLSPRGSTGWFYCTQVAWHAYKEAGVDLDPEGGFWVVPDRFLESPLVEVVARSDQGAAPATAAAGEAVSHAGRP